MIDASLPCRSIIDSSGIGRLLETDGLNELVINKEFEAFIFVNGKWIRHDMPNLSRMVLNQLVNALAVLNGGRVSNESPIVSVTLPDGERGWIVTPPACAAFNFSLTIRKPSKKRFTIADYRNSGRFDNFDITKPLGTDIQPHEKEIKLAIEKRDVEKVCKLAVEHKLNIICGGETGSGKTTFMKALADLYPKNKRYITIEDSLELDMPNHPNIVRLLYSDAIGGVSSKVLVESTKRMRPDHVFLTELKGDESWTYLTLLRSGVFGSLTSAHFNDARSADYRVTDLVKQSPIGQTLDYDFIISTVRTTLDLVMFWEGTYLKEIYYNPEGKLRLMKGESYE